LKEISQMSITISKIFSLAKLGIRARRATLPLFLTFGLLGTSTLGHASTAIWQYQVLFDEFEGNTGGFENEGTGRFLYNNAGTSTSGPNTRSYDFLQQTGATQNGKAIYGSGQDGATDLTVTSQIIDGSAGRWTSLTADKSDNSLRANAIIASGKSKPGDYGVIAYTFTFSAELGITAKDLGVRLTSVNGFGEIYEWSFVTLGGVDDAPFNLGDLATYKNTDYTKVSSGTYYNADGTPSGAAGTGGKLAEGKSISQFLAGQEAQNPSGGAVGPGWFANDDFHVDFKDGPETSFTNPTAGLPDPSKPDTLTVRGFEDLGLDPDSPVTTLTVWMGYMDVGFDSNGDGFSSTNATQRSMISYLNIGASDFTPLPEPSVTLLGGLMAAGLLVRRKR
jgi:hypothetical protein